MRQMFLPPTGHLYFKLITDMKKKIGLIDLICIYERSSVKRTTQHNR